MHAIKIDEKRGHGFEGKQGGVYGQIGGERKEECYN